MSANITKIRRSQTRCPKVPQHYRMTQSEFVTLATLVALQGGCNSIAEPNPLEDVAWMLAYWRAGADDDSLEDRVEMFFHGRTGFSELKTVEELAAEIIGQMTECYWELADEDDYCISSREINDFLDWAWNKFIPWEPEPKPETLDAIQYLKAVSDTAVTLAQFVDHFEDFQVRRLMDYLMSNWGRESRVWVILSKFPSIEVVYGEGNTTFLNFSLNEIPVMTLTIKDWVEFCIELE